MTMFKKHLRPGLSKDTNYIRTYSNGEATFLCHLLSSNVKIFAWYSILQ